MRDKLYKISFDAAQQGILKGNYRFSSEKLHMTVLYRQDQKSIILCSLNFDAKTNQWTWEDIDFDVLQVLLDPEDIKLCLGNERYKEQVVLDYMRCLAARASAQWAETTDWLTLSA